MKQCTKCMIIPYHNTLGIGVYNKDQVICEVCLMTQLDSRIELDCLNTEKCALKVKLNK
jgi:hypothetical protein